MQVYSTNYNECNSSIATYLHVLSSSTNNNFCQSKNSNPHSIDPYGCNNHTIKAQKHISPDNKHISPNKHNPLSKLISPRNIIINESAISYRI